MTPTAQLQTHPLLTESPNENISIEEAQQHIDKAIEKCQDTIVALKSHRNRYAPISRLPPEIMLRIFSFARVQEPDHPGRVYPMELIKLTHVTRHWRNIAIDSPSLWVDLPVGNLQLLEEMLRRSKDASLVINYDHGSTYSNFPGLELALQHSTRAKYLSLQNLTSGLWNDLKKHFPESTPRLEYLALEGYHWGSEDESEAIPITGRILRETGRLRHLELINCDINWASHSHILRSLTHLELHNLSSTSPRPNGKQFVDILKGMPDLKTLDLSCVLPDQTGEQEPWSSDHIHFASLQTLKIDATSNELKSFFSYVTFPPTATVNITCSAVDILTSTNDFSSVILNLGRSYSNCSSAPVFQTIILRKFDLDSGVHVELYEDTLTNELFRPSTPIPSLQLGFFWIGSSDRPSTRQAAIKVLLDIFSSVTRPQHAKGVFLASLCDELDGETIANTFGTLPDVYYVTTAGGASAPFIDSLKLSSHDYSTISTTANRMSTLSFPHLTSICIRDTDFFDSLNGLKFGSLQDCLIHRYESGAEIEKLTLHNCYSLRGEDVDLLEEIVVDVDWDEREVFTEDEEEGEDEYLDSYDDYIAEDFDEPLYSDGDSLDLW